jgi:hypothetical protein
MLAQVFGAVLDSGRFWVTIVLGKADFSPATNAE